MANLIVTFAAAKPSEAALGSAKNALASFRLEMGRVVRTELIAIAAAAELGLLSAEEGDDVISVYAEDDCWITIGDTPTAQIPESEGEVDARFLASGERMQFLAVEGDKVSVIAA